VIAGSSLEDVEAQWKGEIFRVKPKAPKPAPAPPAKPVPDEAPEVRKDDEGNVRSISTGPLHLSVQGTGPAMEWPAAIPENISSARIVVPPAPSMLSGALASAGFQRWVPVVGTLGHVGHVLLRRDPDGLTLIGDGIIDLIDAETLDAELRDAETRERNGYPPDTPTMWNDPKYTTRTMFFACWDAGRQRRCPLFFSGGSASGGMFRPRTLDGDVARWAVVRVHGVGAN
jgi:hypothetical protein